MDLFLKILNGCQNIYYAKSILFIERHLGVIEQKKGETLKAKQSKLNYTINFGMKNRSSGDPHEGVAFPEVECKPLKKILVCVLRSVTS